MSATPTPDRFRGWLASVSVALLALFLRLWHLGRPNALLFDETYYAKDAWSLVHLGYVQSYISDANQKIIHGTTSGLWTGNPSMIVHPEVGKWLIGLGELVFGMNSLGWRISAAVAGSLMVLVMCRLALRMTGSILLATFAGLLLTFDGLELVLSRLGLLDIFVALFMLLGVHCVVADRAWFRARLARRLAGGQVADGGFGPVRGVLWRPWLLAAGVSFGLAIGTKWVALYPLAAFGLLAWLWSAGARRAKGVRWPVVKSALVDGVPAFVQLVAVAVLVYVVSWTGWLVHAHTYEQHLSSTQYTRFVSWDGTCKGEDMTGVKYADKKWPTATEPDASGPGEVVQSLRSLWYYHRDVMTFHRYFLNCATHSYASKPLGWLLVNKGVGADAQLDIKPGQQGCDAAAGSDCLRQVLIIGNPTLWWGCLVTLIASLLLWLGKRDWRQGVAVIGVAVTWLPWLMYDTRPIFFFYAILTLPFLVLSATLVLGELLGRSTAPSPRRTLGVIVGGSFLVLVMANFAWFWPIWTDGLLTHAHWLERIWFERWI